MLQGSRLLSAWGESAISCTGGSAGYREQHSALSTDCEVRFSIMAAIFRKGFPTRCNK
jgi:hypothetical protein